MDDQRLRLQHLYDNPIPKHKFYHYQLHNQQLNRPSPHNLKINTHTINLFPDYDLPLKQLQYTHTRQYKQNLNPIFQQLSTTHNRYSHSRERNHKGKNDDFPVSDRYFANEPKRLQSKKAYRKQENRTQSNKREQNKRQEKLKVQQLKERSRILSENVKNGEKGSILSFGQVKNLNKRIQGKKQKVSQILLPEHDTSILRVKETIHETKDHQQLTSQQLAYAYLQQMISKSQEVMTSVKETQQRLFLLRKQVQMHKQKSLIKQRQVFYLQQQKQSILIKSQELNQSLKEYSLKYTETQGKHNEVSKRLRIKKQELKKEQGWVKEENKEISGIERKIEELLKLMRQAQGQEERCEQFMNEFDQQTQLNNELKQQLSQTQSAIQSLTHQTNLLQQQKGTLQMHHNQLLTLQQKFQQQTDSLLQTVQQLNEQILHKHEFIQQQAQIDELIRQVELEMGQISEKKIMMEQEIHQVNVKISLKKRNVRYMNEHGTEKEREKRDFGKKTISKHQQYQGDNRHVTYGDQPKYENEFSFTSLANHKSHPNNTNKNTTNTTNTTNQYNQNPNNNKQPLATIREQSNTTSAYHSPKLQQHHQPSQNSSSPRQQHIQQPSHHHLESQSLQIDSRMISQTEILKSHHEESSPKKLKKYFVIESQDDAGLSNSKGFNNPKSSFCYQNHPNPNFSHQKHNESHQRNSQQIFIERQKKASIQHRLYDMQNSVLRTEHEKQHQNRNSFSVELQSSNYYNQTSKRLESQESQFPITKLLPKNNQKVNKKKAKQQKVRPSVKPYSNSHRNKDDESPRSSNQHSQDFFQSLIEQYQNIKSNSCFQDSWKHKN